jgi:hypothetical protein
MKSWTSTLAFRVFGPTTVSFTSLMHGANRSRIARPSSSKLVAVEGEEDFDIPVPAHPVRRRVIPTHVKLEVWHRDGGKCVIYGATDELHFDHDLPSSRAGHHLPLKTSNYFAHVIIYKSVTTLPKASNHTLQRTGAVLRPGIRLAYDRPWSDLRQ